MENKKIILVPTDFSEVCSNALHYGAKLAGLMGWSVILVHIIDKKSKSELKKKNLTYAAATKEIESIAAKTAAKFNIEVTSLLREGNIFTSIGEIASEIRAGLVVLGTHGMVDLKQKFSVSYAKRVVVSCSVPVIVVQQNGMLKNNLKNIVFPVSTTAEVRQKIKWAVILAKAFGSKIHILKFAEKLDEDKAKLHVITSQITEEFDKHKIEYVDVLTKKSNSFAQQVKAYAYEAKADLICIITTPISVNFTLHDYEKKILFNSFEIPVMCVNPVETTTMHWY